MNHLSISEVRSKVKALTDAEAEAFLDYLLKGRKKEKKKNAWDFLIEAYTEWEKQKTQ